MKISEVAEHFGWKLLAGEDGKDREINGCYVGDLLSWVMGRAQEDNLWFTVMGNINAIAVAALTDAAGIVLTESAALDEEARNRADMQGIAVYWTEDNTYTASTKVYDLLKK